MNHFLVVFFPFLPLLILCILDISTSNIGYKWYLFLHCVDVLSASYMARHGSRQRRLCSSCRHPPLKHRPAASLGGASLVDHHVHDVNLGRVHWRTALSDWRRGHGSSAGGGTKKGKRGREIDRERWFRSWGWRDFLGCIWPGWVAKPFSP
jgi:hypothetical protein